VKVVLAAFDILCRWNKASNLYSQYFADALTKKAYSMLRQLAESHAKLCFRTTVMPTDALAAINISEKYIRALFDNDGYTSPAEPKFSTIHEIDKFQAKLHQWCLSFIDGISRI
jgi:hypothetical protein